MRSAAIATCLACLVVVPAARAGEIWSVTEEVNGSSSGEWQIEVDHRSLKGLARMVRLNGAAVNYTVDGEVHHREVVLHRLSPSDNTDCVYRGQMNHDGTISGAAFSNGRVGMWAVKRMNMVRYDQHGHHRHDEGHGD